MYWIQIIPDSIICPGGVLPLAPTVWRRPRIDPTFPPSEITLGPLFASPYQVGPTFAKTPNHFDPTFWKSSNHIDPTFQKVQIMETWFLKDRVISHCTIKKNSKTLPYFPYYLLQIWSVFYQPLFKMFRLCLHSLAHLFNFLNWSANLTYFNGHWLFTMKGVPMFNYGDIN